MSAFSEKMRTKKTEVMLLNIATLILFHILFWLGNLYPRHILEFEKWQSIFAILWNLIFHLLYFFFLIICFVKNKSFFSPHVFPKPPEAFGKRIHFKKIGLLFGVQFLVDLLRLGMERYLGEFTYLTFDLISLIAWVAMYFILQWKQEQSVFRQKKRTLLYFGIVILGFLVSFSIALTDYNQYNQLAERLLSTNEHLQLQFKNFIYDCRYRNAIFDVFLCISTFLIQAVKMKGPSVEEKSEVKNFIFLLSLRIFLLWICLSLMFTGKRFMAPQHTVYKIHNGGHEENHYAAPLKTSIYKNSLEKTRMVDYNSSETYSEKEKCQIYLHKEMYYENYKTITNGTKRLATYPTDQLMLPWGRKEYDLGDLYFEVCDNHVIYFMENDEPQVFLMPEIAKQPQNDTLIRICEELIGEGNMVAFEYSCTYLQKYDPVFISFYIDRYAEGTFNYDEVAFFTKNSYNRDFIIKLANEISAISK